MCSVIEFETPDNWEGKTKDFFYYCLFAFGYVAVFDHDKFGMSFQPCTLKGFDFYYQPVSALISNPKYKAKLEIDKECALVKLTPDYFGVWDIIDYYAEKLSALDVSINTSIINSRYSYLLGAKTKSAAQALKKMLDLVNKGEPAVIYDRRIFDDQDTKESPFQSWLRENMKNNYITPELLQDFQTIINNFDREIGIPTIPYEKKERLVTSEAESTEVDAKARSITWISTLNSSIKEVKKLYPDIKLSARLRYDDIDEASDLSIKGGESL